MGEAQSLVLTPIISAQEERPGRHAKKPNKSHNKKKYEVKEDD